jgi:TolB protein
MTHRSFLRPAVSLCAAIAFGVVAMAAVPATPQQQPAPRPPGQDQAREGSGTIISVPGGKPKLAVPDFLAATPDAESKAIAATIGQVLWADLDFEREYYMVPRDTYASIPVPASIDAVPFDRWKELGADGLVIGAVRKTATGVTVQVKLYNVAGQTAAFSKEYSGTAANPRIFAHTISDEIHKQQRNLNGVARTKLTFSSDRDGERMKGTVYDRRIKEIYISDYDGANPRRITVNRSLNINPVWSSDGKAIAYTSYRRANFPDIFIQRIYEGTPPESPAHGTDRIHNFLPAWSPDGTKIAFMTNRDGNQEIYVMDANGGNPRRITRHPGIDATPTWSPAGNQIAFTSDRSGSPQIYIVDADGLGQPQRITTDESWADRATWSPAPFNEIAYAARSGPGFDIKIYDVAARTTRTITNGEGSNESPAFSPTGRHLAFASTRLGNQQIFVVGRDGNGLHQVTKEGNNFTPNWSR